MDLPENDRPISLLNLGYKLFAALVHKRLVEGGAEDRLSASQFGFRSGRSTVDAIFMLRRQLDLAWAQRGGRLVVLALDWAKAFDSVSPAALAKALLRFGLPRHFVTFVEAIHKDRLFFVSNNFQNLQSIRKCSVSRKVVPYLRFCLSL